MKIFYSLKFSYSSSVVIKPDTMVLLHVKRSEESQFLHSCNVMDNVEEVLMKVTYKIIIA